MSKDNEAILAALKEKVDAQGISRFFDTELEELGPGKAKVSMTCKPEMANILGMVHGTALFALIDEALVRFQRSLPVSEYQRTSMNRRWVDE